MNRRFEYHITAKDGTISIKEYLQKKGYSHPLLIQLKKTPNGIQKNNVWAHVSDKLQEGDILTTYLVESHPSEHIPPVSHPLDIVFEDEDIIVLNKASCMPIHPSLHNYENTLANALCHYYKEEDSPFIFRCMNRLDRDTTGLTIVAKNALSASILSKDMKERHITRYYYAIVDGIIHCDGCINAPIGRVSDSIIERCIDYENGQSAITHYEPIKIQSNMSLIRLRLETGRTHQIRVHMKHIGHPLLGDFIYYPDFSKIQRQALHAGELIFEHPITKEHLHLTAPLPDDMASLFK